MQARATAKYVSMAPRKVRFVIDTIRGKYASDALAQLHFTPNHAADEIANVLRSAIANAENNHGLDPERLKVAECYVDGGPTAKRVQPRAQGRAYRILKRTSHITIVVEETTPKPRRPKTAPKQRQPLRASLPTPAAPAAEETAAVEETTAPVELTAGEAAPTDATASSAAGNETPGEKA